MKKLAYIFILLCILCFHSQVNAYELTCGGGPYNYNDSFVCTIKGANNINYDVMKGSITNDPNVACLTSSFASGMQSRNNEDASNKFDLYGRSANDEIVSFKCQVIGKVNEDTTVQLMVNDFTYHDSASAVKEANEILRSNNITLQKYEENTQPKDDKPRDTTNSNSRLKGISAEGLDFTFSSFVTEYNIDVVYEVDEINLLVLPNNIEAQYRIQGSQKLEVGDNVIDIYVTSPDKTSTTCYTLYIKRLPRGEAVYHPESDATLKDLIISGQKNIDFDKDNLEYRIHITYDVNSVDINAVPTVETAKVTIANNNDLSNGDVISVIVVSEDGTEEKRYLINVVKDPEPYDYTKILILGGISVLALILIILFIRTSKKNKDDPLMKIKKDKRGINKGQTLDLSNVPEANSATPGVNAQGENPQPNVINAGTANVVTPMQVDPNAVDTNRNKITSNVNTLNLNNAALPASMPVGTEVINQAPVAGTMPVNQVTPVTQVTPVAPVNPMPQGTVMPVNPPTPVMPTPPATPVGIPSPVVPQNPAPVPSPTPEGTPAPQVISLDTTVQPTPVITNQNNNQQ